MVEENIRNQCKINLANLSWILLLFLVQNSQCAVPVEVATEIVSAKVSQKREVKMQIPPVIKSILRSRPEESISDDSTYDNEYYNKLEALKNDLVNIRNTINAELSDKLKEELTEKLNYEIQNEFEDRLKKEVDNKIRNELTRQILNILQKKGIKHFNDVNRESDEAPGFIRVITDLLSLKDESQSSEDVGYKAETDANRKPAVIVAHIIPSASPVLTQYGRNKPRDLMQKLFGNFKWSSNNDNLKNTIIY